MIEARYDKVTTPTGDFKLLKDFEAIVNSYINLLNIKRGSYPFDPEVGTEIDKYVFELDDETTYDLLREEVIRTLEQEDRAEVLSVDLAKTTDPKTILITVKAKIKDRTIRISMLKQKGGYLRVSEVVGA